MLSSGARILQSFANNLQQKVRQAFEPSDGMQDFLYLESGNVIPRAAAKVDLVPSTPTQTLTVPVNATPGSSLGLSPMRASIPNPPPACPPNVPQPFTWQRPLCVSPFTYDIVQGMMNGVLLGLLEGGPLHLIDKPQTNMAVHRLTLSASFSSINNPFLGMGYNIITKLPRHILALPTLPLMRDKLKELGYDPLTAKMLASVVFMLFDSTVNAPNKAKTIVESVSKQNKWGAWDQLSLKQQRASILQTLIWSSAKGVVYLPIMLVIADLINRKIQKLTHPRSYILKECDALFSGFAASVLTTPLSFPLNVVEKQRAVDPKKPIFKPMKDCYVNHGLREVVTKHTHIGLSLALLRQGFYGMFFYGALKGSEEAARYFMKKDVRHDGCDPAHDTHHHRPGKHTS